MNITLEVICTTIADAVAAWQGGADRIELIDNYLEGGTTPSPGIIRTVKQVVSIPVYVMIRPRGGGFVYSSEELNAMIIDAAEAHTAGADGIVTGALTAEGSLDFDGMKRVSDAARLPITFHRAFDALEFSVMEGVLEDLEKLPRVERVLTSGGRPTAFEGRDVLAGLVARAGRLSIMPGGDVELETVRELIEKTGVREVHVGTAARREPSPTSVVCPERVRAVRRAIDA